MCIFTGQTAPEAVFHTIRFIFQIQYSYDRGPSGSSVVQSFKVLGWLTLSQLVGSSLMLGYKILKDKSYFFQKNGNSGSQR